MFVLFPTPCEWPGDHTQDVRLVASAFTLAQASLLYVQPVVAWLCCW